MRICEVKLYTYQELSDKAKERARDEYRTANRENDFDYSWVIDHFVELLEAFGVWVDKTPEMAINGRKYQRPKVWFRGFWSQGDGASFEGRYEFRAQVLKNVKAMYPQDEELHGLAKRLQDLQSKQRRKKLSATITTNDSHYCHEHTMRFEFQFGGDDYWDTSPAREGAMTEFADIMRSLARWLYRHLEEEYEHQNSDETIGELLANNEYEFTEDGGAH